MDFSTKHSFIIFSKLLINIVESLVINILLVLVYYLIVTPISLIFKIAGKQFLELKLDKVSGTYWNYRSDENKSM